MTTGRDVENDPALIVRQVKSGTIHIDQNRTASATRCAARLDRNARTACVIPRVSVLITGLWRARRRLVLGFVGDAIVVAWCDERGDIRERAVANLVHNRAVGH